MIERIWLFRSRWGDPAAFPVLYRRYCGPVYRVALHLLGSPAGAEQVVRRVFMTLWRDLPQLYTPFAFRVYLYRVLVAAVEQADASAEALPGRAHMAWLLVDQVGLSSLEAARVLGWTPRTLREELAAGRGALAAGAEALSDVDAPAALWDWEQVMNTAAPVKRPDIDLRDPRGWLHALATVAACLLLAAGLPLLVRAALRPVPVRPAPVQPTTAKTPGIDVQSQMIKNGATSFGQPYQVFGHTFVEQNPPGKLPEAPATPLIPADELAAHVPPDMLLPTVTPDMTNFRVSQSGSLTTVSWEHNSTPYILRCVEMDTWPTLITNGPARNVTVFTPASDGKREAIEPGLAYEDERGAFFFLLWDQHLYSLFTTDRNGNGGAVITSLLSPERAH